MQVGETAAHLVKTLGVSPLLPSQLQSGRPLDQAHHQRHVRVVPLWSQPPGGTGDVASPNEHASSVEARQRRVEREPLRVQRRSHLVGARDQGGTSASQLHLGGDRRGLGADPPRRAFATREDAAGRAGRRQGGLRLVHEQRARQRQLRLTPTLRKPAAAVDRRSLAQGLAPLAHQTRCQEYGGPVGLAGGLADGAQRSEQRLGGVHLPQRRHQVAPEQSAVAEVVPGHGFLDRKVRDAQVHGGLLEIMLGQLDPLLLEVDTPTVQQGPSQVVGGIVEGLDRDVELLERLGRPSLQHEQQTALAVDGASSVLREASASQRGRTQLQPGQPVSGLGRAVRQARLGLGPQLIAVGALQRHRQEPASPRQAAGVDRLDTRLVKLLGRPHAPIIA